MKNNLIKIFTFLSLILGAALQLSARTEYIRDRRFYDYNKDGDSIYLEANQTITVDDTSGFITEGRMANDTTFWFPLKYGPNRETKFRPNSMVRFRDGYVSEGYMYNDGSYVDLYYGPGRTTRFYPQSHVKFKGGYVSDGYMNNDYTYVDLYYGTGRTARFFPKSHIKFQGGFVSDGYLSDAVYQQDLYFGSVGKATFRPGSHATFAAGYVVTGALVSGYNNYRYNSNGATVSVQVDPVASVMANFPDKDSINSYIKKVDDAWAKLLQYQQIRNIIANDTGSGVVIPGSMVTMDSKEALDRLAEDDTTAATHAIVYSSINNLSGGYTVKIEYPKIVFTPGADGTGYVAICQLAQGGIFPVVGGMVSVSAGTVCVFEDGYYFDKVRLPIINQDPVNQTVAASGTLTLSVSAIGLPKPTYQWYKSFTAITGATGATYTKANITSSDAGSYHVVVTNSAGSVTSSSAYVTVSGGSSSSGGSTGPTNVAPVPSITVDGRGAGTAVILNTVVTVRYSATDANNNLSGIRYNIWNADTGYFDNGGDFVAQSGGSGEVVKTFTLSTPGDWYFWTDAQDSAGAYRTTGDWAQGFKLTVSTATCESITTSGSPTSEAFFEVYANNVQNATRVVFPVWTDANSQDDIHWYEGEYDAANNRWKRRVSIADHNNESGFYNVHVYALGTKDEWVCLGGTSVTQQYAAPTWDSVTNSSAQVNGTLFEVYANNVHNAARVVFPTWTAANGQDEIHWYEGEYDAANNRWKKVVNTADHNGESGLYITHAYAIDTQGQWYMMGGVYTEVVAPIYKIVSVNSGKVLDIYNGWSDDGTNIQQWDYNGAPWQQWKLESAGNGAYYIRSVHTGKVLDVQWESVNFYDFAYIIQNSFSGSMSQQWYIDDIGDGSKLITNANSGLVMDVEGVSMDNGALVHQWEYLGASNQFWRLERVN